MAVHVSAFGLKMKNLATAEAIPAIKERIEAVRALRLGKSRQGELGRFSPSVHITEVDAHRAGIHACRANPFVRAKALFAGRSLQTTGAP